MAKFRWPWSHSSNNEWFSSAGAGTGDDPRRNINAEFYLEVTRGNVPGHSVIHKFGYVNLLDTNPYPVAAGGIYRTPTTATALEAVSSSSADGVGGNGAREITVIGIDSNWNESTQTVIMNGVTPVALGTNLLRLHRAFISSGGSYATQSIGSHVGTITIRGAAAGPTWATIDTSPLPLGQTRIGAYTVPIGHTGYLLAKRAHVDSGKTANIFFFYRDNCDDVTAPYSGCMRMLEEEIGVIGGENNVFVSPAKELIGPCDAGMIARVPQTAAEVTCEFELLIIKDGYR